MHSVADLVEPNIVEELAHTPADFHTGSRLYDADEVSFRSYARNEVVGQVGQASEPHVVSLLTDGAKLSWRCTCNSDMAVFCKHLVAVALATWNRTPVDTI
jgi:uncharacterized Zn finger protein